MYVIKRDGSRVKYDLEKISIAISGAFEEFGREFSDAVVLNEIEAKIFDDITVEQIQDIVEEKFYTLIQQLYDNFFDYKVAFRLANQEDIIQTSQELQNICHQLFTIKEKHLDDNEHLNNFILDAYNATEMMARFLRNDILENG